MGISIRDLSKSYGEKTILSSLSAELPTVGLVKVSGNSGTGKTTLLRIIAGLDNDYSGTVDGVGSVSFMFQDHRLFPWLGALENVIVAAFESNSEANRNEAIEMLKTLGFSDDEMRLKPAQLSGGMKQRVSLARALLRNSDVLILDEPTKELDRNLISIVCALIRGIASQRLVLLVSHDTTLDELIEDYEIHISSSDTAAV